MIIEKKDDIMMKLPPIEKIPEAYTAIEDNRVELFDTYAIVKSSNYEKEYLIKWKDNVYYSNDNATYWQGYIGYPIIAVLMLKGELSLNKNIVKYFKNINWNKLNKENNRDYRKSLEQILVDVSDSERKLIEEEINKVYEEIKLLDIELTKKKNLDE